MHDRCKGKIVVFDKNEVCKEEAMWFKEIDLKDNRFSQAYLVNDELIIGTGRYHKRYALYDISVDKVATNNIIIDECLDFDYPIIFDEGKRFLQKNQLDEKDKIFTSFLLDKKNKVLMVGSPIRNEKILKLYNSILYR